MSFKFKAGVRFRDPKMLADIMKSYPGAKNVNTKDYASQESEFFGSTICKFNLPPGADSHFHQPNKVNYSIPRPNT